MKTPLKTSFSTWLRPALALGAAGLLLSGAAAQALDPAAQYQQDRAFCNSSQSYQDRETCLREAGAAYQQRGQIGGGADAAAYSVYEQNALARCEFLQGDDKQDCRARMQGKGDVRGSVTGGGVLRELVTTIPAKPAVPAAR